LLSGARCSPSQADFLDRMQPQYKLAGTPRVVLSKIADGANCDTVRATLSQR
jgi:hypothetical protein